MRKFLKISISLLALSIFLVIASCGKKNINKVNVDSTYNDNEQETTATSNVNTKNEEDVAEINNTLDKNSMYNGSQQFILPKQKEVKLLDEHFIKSENNANLAPLESIHRIYLINTVPVSFTSLEYCKMYFSKFLLVGYSILNTNKSLNPKSIKLVAQKYGANLVIYKSIYNTYKDNYTIEMVYLNGDLTDPEMFMNRNSSEAIPIETTLTSLNLKNKNPSNRYSLKTALGIPDNKEAVVNDKNKPLLDNNADVLNPVSDNMIQPHNVLNNNEGTQLSEEEALKSDKADTMDNSIQKLEDRINTLVGLWVDSYDKTLVSIHEIARDRISKYDNGTLVDSNVIKYYGAYIILRDDKVADKYNADRSINTDGIFKWNNEDLKFQFNSSGKYGIYLNKNKMPEVAIIKPFPVKGILMVTMSSGETRYYLPLGLDIDPKFIRSLYKDLPPYIPPKSTKDTITSHYGTGMYGWVISGGIILLSLGLLSIF